MWRVEFLPKALEEEANLPKDMQARLGHVIDVIKLGGLHRLSPTYMKSLGDKLWEFRISGKDGIARAIYVTMKQERVVIVRIFVKKTQKTPPREIALARRRARDVK